MTYSANELRTATISCLLVIVSGCLTCNSCAIAFINTNKSSKNSLKDKIVTLFCGINILQAVGYLIELHAAVKSEITAGECQSSAFIICMLTYISIGYFVTLTLERYLAIKLPYKYVIWFSEGRNTWWLGIPPVFGLLLAAAPLTGWSRYDKSHEFATSCSISFDNTFNAQSYFVVASILAFVVPVIVTVVCFARILSELRDVADDMKRKYGRSSLLCHQVRTSVKDQWLACLMTGVVYIGSWVPYASVCYFRVSGGNISEITELITLFLCKSSTISSPIVYCLVEKRFRRYVCRRLNAQFQPMLGNGAKNSPVSV